MEPPNTQLPATIQQAEVTADQRALNVVPAIIADLGDEAGWRYVEFFTKLLSAAYPGGRAGREKVN